LGWGQAGLGCGCGWASSDLRGFDFDKQTHGGKGLVNSWVCLPERKQEMALHALGVDFFHFFLLFFFFLFSSRGEKRRKDRCVLVLRYMYHLALGWGLPGLRFLCVAFAMRWVGLS
jgi:hypothetical protein